MKFALVFIFFFLGLNSFAQLPAGCPTSTSSRCDGWPLSKLQLDQQAGGSLLEFEFDKMSEYTSGITYYGTTILRVTASDTAAGISDCAWKLRMIVNNGGAPNPAGEWLQLSSYGPSGAQPTIGLLEVRVTNNCATSPVNGTWQTFSLPQNGGEIVLIDNGSFVNAAGIGGGCGGGETNGKGSYLTSYGEFAFVVDYRIRPNFNYNPGKYELNVKFCISENL